VREVSVASDIRSTDPAKALNDLRVAADLNPFSPDPGRIGGTIALQTGQYAIARDRFAQAISRERGDWFSWRGAGLATSALGHRAAARHDFEVAGSINRREQVIQEALARVGTAHPLTPSEALPMITSVL
jgi:Flp pilus assembly protein TadD